MPSAAEAAAAALAAAATPKPTVEVDQAWVYGLGV